MDVFIVAFILICFLAIIIPIIPIISKFLIKSKKENDYKEAVERLRILDTAPVWEHETKVTKLYKEPDLTKKDTVLTNAEEAIKEAKKINNAETWTPIQKIFINTDTLKKHWNKCMYCGKFIALTEFNYGTATVELITPDSEYSKKVYDVYHNKCVVSLH
jgi:hypothetical protein